MKKAMFCLALALAACGQRPPGAAEELNGRWRVQQIAGASLGEGVDIWIDINPATGAMSGFTGCNNFTARMDAYGQGVIVSQVQEEGGGCASAAAATDEARFLGVLPLVQRRILRGRSLELLQTPQGSEALLRLRREDQIGG